MELSARNQLDGPVKDVKLGTIMSEVTVDASGSTGLWWEARSRPRSPELWMPTVRFGFSWPAPPSA